MKVAFFFQNTTSWIENGHLEYVKYDSCLQRKIFLKKKKRQLLKRIFSLKKRKRDLFSFLFHSKENSSLPFFAWQIGVLVVIKGCFFFFWKLFVVADTKRTNSNFNVNLLHLTKISWVKNQTSNFLSPCQTKKITKKNDFLSVFDIYILNKNPAKKNYFLSFGPIQATIF